MTTLNQILNRKSSREPVKKIVYCKSMDCEIFNSILTISPSFFRCFAAQIAGK